MSFKILVADDSGLFRRVLAEVLATVPGIEVVGTVSNGRLAVQRVRELAPDLLTLDMEMPEMDGLAVLDALRQSGSNTSVLVLSALTRKGGQLTLRALEKGAFDFITKPDTANLGSSREALLREVVPRVRALMHRLEVRNILRSKNHPTGVSTVHEALKPANKPTLAPLESTSPRVERHTFSARPEMVLIGVSTGGPNALARLLPYLPANLGVPLLIVQHMPPIFTQSLADSLAAKCALRVREAVHGEVLEANTAYIAPGGRQMRVLAAVGRGACVQITDDPPENNCRPSVDYLFRSVANSLPGKSMAVILTGMGNDGTLGLRLLKRHGCFSIAQDEATCVVYGMPKAAVEAGVVDVILPLDAIAGRIVTTVRGAAP